MRTTLSLDDDVLEQVKRYAESRSMGLGKAVSTLLRREFAGPLRTKVVNGLVVFDPPEDAPVVTTERVKQLENEEW